MNGTMSRLLCSSCRIVLLALTAGLALFAMGVLVEPDVMRQSTLDLLTRLVPAPHARG